MVQGGLFEGLKSKWHSFWNTLGVDGSTKDLQGNDVVLNCAGTISDAAFPSAAPKLMSNEEIVNYMYTHNPDLVVFLDNHASLANESVFTTSSFIDNKELSLDDILNTSSDNNQVIDAEDGWKILSLMGELLKDTIGLED